MRPFDNTAARRRVVHIAITRWRVVLIFDPLTLSPSSLRLGEGEDLAEGRGEIDLARFDSLARRVDF